MTTALTIERVDLLHLSMQLLEPFVTSFGPQRQRDIVLVRLYADGVQGWGELVAGREPTYSEESVVTATAMLRHHLLGMVLGRTVDDPRQVARWWAGVRGNPMAKAAVEMAVWDAWARATGRSLALTLSAAVHDGEAVAPATAVAAGVSVGIHADAAALVDRVAGYVEQGYARIKLKIAPGRDLTEVAAVRERFGDARLMVDANSAYTLADAGHLAALDAFDLTMIEQPLAHDDIVDHATLAPQLRTPICLDESIRSIAHARQALHLGACRIVNCKPGRLGGHGASLALHRWATAAGVPLWVGGMLESGVGRLHNIALASLPGFTLPGDTSASDRYWAADIIDPPVRLSPDGTVAVPTAPGIGHAIDVERLESVLLHTETFVPGSGDRS
ncbi:MAG TPA: o-succinylbenzoate synthase [Euzebyales bacterium]|nr:o-succinylbenzoate synthase [Euzebyales bacterium]